MMAARAETFWNHVVESGYVIDPQGVHHEFNQGLHGQKAEYDNIVEGTELFEEWLDTTARFIHDTYQEKPDAIVGVANGTNRVAEPVAEMLGSGVVFLETGKDETGRPVLTDEAKLLVEAFQPVFALVVEDVGTRGTNSLSVVRSMRANGVEYAEVLNALQRAETLPLLDEAGIVYRSMTKYVLPNFTPTECRALPEGFCKRGWELIRYKQRK